MGKYICTQVLIINNEYDWLSSNHEIITPDYLVINNNTYLSMKSNQHHGFAYTYPTNILLQTTKKIFTCTILLEGNNHQIWQDHEINRKLNTTYLPFPHQFPSHASLTLANSKILGTAVRLYKKVGIFEARLYSTRNTKAQHNCDFFLLHHFGLKTMTIAVQLSLQRRSRIASLTSRRLIDVMGKPSCSTSKFFVSIEQDEYFFIWSRDYILKKEKCNNI